MTEAAPLPDVVPMLSYEDCSAAADWLVEAFGFEEVERFDEDGEVTHVTMRAGHGFVFLGKPGASYVNPKHLREQSEAAARMYEVPWVVDGVWVQVDDVGAHFDQARAAGARPLGEVEDGPLERRYRVEDLEGHRWMFVQR
jgi:PhnB protein